VEYTLLIYNRTDAPQGTDEERQAMFAEFGKYTQALMDSGAHRGGDPLQPPDTATTVRSENGETLTTDGPFAETKEWLAGYYKIEVESLDDALEWAARIPTVKFGGSVEVRPLLPIPAGFPTGA
jgi:hypothetical protein